MSDEGKSDVGTVDTDFFSDAPNGDVKPDSQKTETPVSEPVAQSTPVTSVVDPVTVSGNKVVKFHSRRANFGACIRPKQVIRDGMGRLVKEVPAKEVLFKMNSLETEDPEIIAWLEAYMKQFCDEVFRMPELDPLLVGDVTGRLDSMQLTELRAACRSRNIEIVTTDDENALRYKLLRKISGLSEKK